METSAQAQCVLLGGGAVAAVAHLTRRAGRSPRANCRRAARGGGALLAAQGALCVGAVLWGLRLCEDGPPSAGERNGCLNDALCPPFTTHGAPIRQPLGAEDGPPGAAANHSGRRLLGAASTQLLQACDPREHQPAPGGGACGAQWVCVDAVELHRSLHEHAAGEPSGFAFLLMRRARHSPPTAPQ
jgi:hypothetical protein